MGRGELTRRAAPVTIVNACLRDGRGGSPTAVIDEDAALTDAERRQVPVRHGTSHAVFVTRSDPTRTTGGTSDTSAVELRFFTATGELPACGHGTVAALAYLTAHHRGTEQTVTLRTGGRTVTGHGRRDGDRFHAVFDPGPVTMCDPAPTGVDLVAAALGIDPDRLVPGARVATLGRSRMLIPVATPGAVADLSPDLDRLRAACDRFGLLGCYVHSAPTNTGRVTARMFAPSIGVPEDIANANSTACLAAHLAGRGVTDLAVDMGDALGSPATVTAAVRPGPTGWRILVGGTAAIVRHRSGVGR